MLVNPQTSGPFRVVGIDPGSSTLGVSILETELIEPQYTVVDAFTLKASETVEHYPSIVEIHGGRLARIQHHGDELLRILYSVKPHAIIVETPFMHRFATTFQALTETMLIIRTTVQQYDPHMFLHTVEPVTAKIALGMSKKNEIKDKEEVRRRLIMRKDLTWHIDPKSLDEHSVDAVAVGLYYFLKII